MIEEPHIRSETLTLTRGDVNIHLVSRSPLGPEADRVFQWMETAVAGVEEFFGLAWEPVNFAVYFEPGFKGREISDLGGLYMGDYVLINDSVESVGRHILYHEFAHHYSRNGPKMVIRGRSRTSIQLHR